MQDITEASDATTQEDLCVMRNFAPMEMPARPDNLEVAEQGAIQVAQVGPPLCLPAAQNPSLLFWACRMPSISTKYHKQLG